MQPQPMEKEWIEIGVTVYHYNTGSANNGNYLHKLTFTLEERQMAQSVLEKFRKALKHDITESNRSQIADEYFGVDGFLESIDYIHHVRRSNTDISQEFKQ